MKATCLQPNPGAIRARPGDTHAASAATTCSPSSSSIQTATADFADVLLPHDASSSTRSAQGVRPHVLMFNGPLDRAARRGAPEHGSSAPAVRMGFDFRSRAGVTRR